MKLGEYIKFIIVVFVICISYFHTFSLCFYIFRKKDLCMYTLQQSLFLLQSRKVTQKLTGSCASYTIWKDRCSCIFTRARVYFV